MTLLELLIFLVCGSVAHGTLWLLGVVVISKLRDPWYDISNKSFMISAALLLC